MTASIGEAAGDLTDRPRRIQLRRTRGWRKPAGAVVVARPSRWGNPFRVGELVTPAHDGWSIAQGWAKRGERGELLDFGPIDAAAAVAMYEAWIARAVGSSGFTISVEARSELRGRDLACWCPLGQPCHADVPLEVANA